jgi:ankyrin repeat protein
MSQSNTQQVKDPKNGLWANKIEGTQVLKDEHVKGGVIALMELARDGHVDDFKAAWKQFNLNRGVAFGSTDVKFEEQEMELEMLYAKQIQALVKLYEDEELARALAKYKDKERARALKLYEDEDEEPARALPKVKEEEVRALVIAKLYKYEERARALAKLYEDAKQARALAKLDGGEEQARPLKDFMTNVKEHEKAITWITLEVQKIVHEVKDGAWRSKGAKDKGAKNRDPDRKAKEKVAKGDWHVLKVIGNALPAIYPGRTALHMAAANGNSEIVRAICDVGEEVDLNKRDVFGYTPLHLACYSTHPRRDEVIKILLATQYIDANAAAKPKGYYFTPLHLAIKAKSTDIVDMLLDWCPIGKNYRKVLDVDTKSISGWTALHLAVRMKILETDDEKKAELLTMVVAIIRFINANIPESINKSDNTKSTPLHTSVTARDLELVERLLEDGDKIDPELLDNERRTALEIAVHQNDFPMVQKIQHYLERAGIVGNHQAFADSASAILVGAALLVTVTFAAWAQIPTDDSTLFWVFISLSFYFAVAAFLSAAGAAIPSKGSTLGIIRRAVLISAFCLAISLACAVAAFAIAGFLIVPPGIEHKRKVIATTVIGGFVCLFCLLSFIRKIFKALGLFFLMLDLVAQQQLVKCISTVVTTILGTFLEDQYNALYTTPINNFFKIGEEDDQTSSHGGSVSNSNPGNENSGDETRDS